MNKKEETLGEETPYPAAYLPVGQGYCPTQAKLEQRRIEAKMGFQRHCDGGALVRKKALKAPKIKEKEESSEVKGATMASGSVWVRLGPSADLSHLDLDS